MTEPEKLNAPSPPVPVAGPKTEAPPERASPVESNGADAEAEKAAREAEDEIKSEGSQEPAPIDRKELRRKLKQVTKKFKNRRFAREGSGNRVGRGSVVIAEGETVHDGVAYGGSLTVNGETTGDAVAIGGEVIVNGHVTGSAVAIGGGIHLGPRASVDKDVVSIGGQIIKEEGAEIGGDQLSGDVGRWTTGIVADVMRQAHNLDHDIDNSGHGGWNFRPPRAKRLALGIPLFLLHFAILFGLGFLFMIFAPGRMRMIESELKREPLKCGLTGLVGFMAMFALSLLLFITVVGILLAVVLWIAAVLGIAMGIGALANEIGTRLPFPAMKTQALVLALGVLVLLAVWWVPYLGNVALCFIILLSFGAIIRTRFGQKPTGVPEPI
jgi:hypothetical protein